MAAQTDGRFAAAADRQVVRWTLRAPRTALRIAIRFFSGAARRRTSGCSGHLLRRVN